MVRLRCENVNVYNSLVLVACFSLRFHIFVCSLCCMGQPVGVKCGYRTGNNRSNETYTATASPEYSRVFPLCRSVVYNDTFQSGLKRHIHRKVAQSSCHLKTTQL